MTGPSPIRRSDALPADYPQFLAEIKARIAAARTRAALAVNSELIRLYWEIGHEILEREQREGWGARVINRLAADLRREFPDMTGLSLRNLRYMRAFARAWPAESPSSSIVQQPVAQLPWGHNVTLLTKLKDREARPRCARRGGDGGRAWKQLAPHPLTRGRDAPRPLSPGGLDYPRGRVPKTHPKHTPHMVKLEPGRRSARSIQTSVSS